MKFKKFLKKWKWLIIAAVIIIAAIFGPWILEVFAWLLEKVAWLLRLLAKLFGFLPSIGLTAGGLYGKAF